MVWLELKYVIKLYRYEGPTAHAGSIHISEGYPDDFNGFCQGVSDLQGVHHSIEKCTDCCAAPLASLSALDRFHYRVGTSPVLYVCKRCADSHLG